MIKINSLIKILGVFTSAALLAGCSSTPRSSDVSVLSGGSPADVYQVEGDLDQAAAKATAALQTLADIKKAQHPVKELPFENLDAPVLKKVIPINNYYGPIAAILRTVTNEVGYQLQIFGKPPRVPVLINLSYQGQQVTALEMLQNIDLQAGDNAAIMILPKYKVVSLRYMSS